MTAGDNGVSAREPDGTADRVPPTKRDAHPASDAVPVNRRVLPHSLDAEASVLGGIVHRNALLPQVQLQPDDFYDPRHHAIFAAVEALAVDGKPIDEVTLDAQLQSMGKLEAVGGMAYIAQLGLRVPTADNAVHYAGIVRDLSSKRRLMLTASEIASKGYEPSGEIGDYLDHAEKRIAEIARRVRGGASCWANRDELVAQIWSRKDERWLSLGLGTTEITSVRAGSVVTLSGPTGAGKTSLAIGMALRHAREQGPALILSRELTADELAARAIGMSTDTAWSAVLRGEVPQERMLEALPDRLRVIDRERATLDALDAELAAMRAVDADAPVLVVVDYGQLFAERSEHLRATVGAVWAAVDAIARRRRAVVLMLSQMSRAASRSARGGERLGADAVDGGAESADIERYSTNTLEIGQAGAEDQYGRREVQVSLGKGRMGGGDRVLPCVYEGRSGRWAVVGNARPAAEVKAEAKAKSGSVRIDTLVRAIRDLVATSETPMSKADITRETTGNSNDIAAAIKRLESNGDLVQVVGEGARRKGGHAPLWTADRAAKAGLTIVPTVVRE